MDKATHQMAAEILLEAIRLLTAEVRALRRASSAEADERPEPIGIDVFGQPIFPQEAILDVAAPSTMPMYDPRTGKITMPPDFQRDAFGAVIGPALTSPEVPANAGSQCSAKFDAAPLPSSSATVSASRN